MTVTNAPKRVHGGVITDPHRRTHGIIQLLSYHVRDKIDLTYYEHPNQIELGRTHQFIIVLALDDIAGVLRHYRARNLPPPVIIHLDRPEALAAVDYEAAFPGVEIVPVGQALMGDKDITLQIDTFQSVVRALEARC